MEDDIRRLQGTNESIAEGPVKKDGIVLGLPKTYQVPRKVVLKSLETLDGRDSPERPGMMYKSTLKDMIARFDFVFGLQRPWRKKQVEHVMQHLHQHTRRRWGDSVLEEGFIEWGQTSKVYELFVVNLNMFERVFFTIDVSESTSVLSKFCSFFLVGMILLSIVTWMISTLPTVQYIPEDCQGTGENHTMVVGDCPPVPVEFFVIMEAVSVIIFTAEYVIKLVTVHSVRFELLQNDFLDKIFVPDTEREGSAERRCENDDVSNHLMRKGGNATLKVLDGRFKTTMKFIAGVPNVIDLLAILPFWIEKIMGGEDQGGFLVVLRILRLTRVFRVFKLGRYNDVFMIFKRVMQISMPALGLMLFFITIGLCLFGTLIWFAEQGEWHPHGNPMLLNLSYPILDRGAYLRHDGSLDPDGFEESPFPSIVHSFWYVLVTITTVGYGDVSPTSGAGKAIGTVTILCGVIVLAMPIGVLGANFSNEYYKTLEEKKWRLMMQRQMELLMDVEREQDAAVTFSAEQSSLEAPRGPHLAEDARLELNKVDIARQKLLAKAQQLDLQWKDLLPEVFLHDLSQGLRSFAAAVLFQSKQSEHGLAANTDGQADPMQRVDELDELCTKVNIALHNVTSFDELSEFGLHEAIQCRREWAEFVDKCWTFVLDTCKEATAMEPPDYAEMRRAVLRTGTVGGQGECSTPSAMAVRSVAGTEDTQSGTARSDRPPATSSIDLDVALGSCGEGASAGDPIEQDGRSERGPSSSPYPFVEDADGTNSLPAGRVPTILPGMPEQEATQCVASCSSRASPANTNSPLSIA